MSTTPVAFLKTLLQTPGIAGEEGPIQAVCRGRLAQYVDAISGDVHGNQFYHLNTAGAPRVLLTAHADQIGLMVQSVDDRGFLRVCAAGGVDAATWSAQRVRVHGPRGSVPGVLGRRPLPLIPEAERGAAMRVDELWVDIGARDKREAGRMAPVGSGITIDAAATPLLNGRIAARGLDNRIGVFIVVETMRRLSRRRLRAYVCGATTVQEEIGLRGATTAAYACAPDIAVNVDVNFATDHPGGEPEIHGDTRLSGGPILGKGPGSTPWVVAQLEAVARKRGIPFQVRAEPDAGGTDAGAVQISRGGVAVADIGVPNRYMHTAVETVCLDDARHTIRLVTAWIAGLPGR